MFERFTDRARRLVTIAQEKARALNHKYIGTEHLLLGLVDDPSSVASKALESLGVPLVDVRERVLSLVGPGPEPARRRHIPFTPYAKKCLELSLREALQMGHNYVGTEHILLALIREGEGISAQALLSFGADLTTVRSQVVALLTEKGAAEAVGGGAFATARRRRARSTVATAGEPLCPHCEGLLSNTATYRVVDVPEQGGDGKLKMLVVFCRSCGTTIDTLVAPEEP